jgi:hypothetical protein
MHECSVAEQMPDTRAEEPKLNYLPEPKLQHESLAPAPAPAPFYLPQTWRNFTEKNL